jgi:hypothetical protein
MAHYLVSGSNHRAVAHDTKKAHRGGYRFGRGSVRPHRRSWKRMKRWFNVFLAAIAAAKLRRVRRELELRGVRLHDPDQVWIAQSLRHDGN